MLFSSKLLVLSLCFCNAWADYYKILGVDKKATSKQIKKKFNQLALTHHPDKNKEPGANEKFMEMNTACDVLTDEKKRKVYDKIGHGAYVDAVKRGEDPEQTMNDPFSHFTHGGHESFFSNAHEFFNNDDFFGGGPDLHRGGMFFSQNGAPMFQSDDYMDLDDIMFDPHWESGSHFGSGKTFFGGGHFKQHQEHHNEAHARAHHNRDQFFEEQGGHFFSMFDEDIEHSSEGGARNFHSQRSQKCVTRSYRNSDGQLVESTSCTIG